VIGTSLAEYLFIQARILFLHNIAPISIMYSVQPIISQFLCLPTCLCHIPFPIQVWLIAEAVFCATVFIPLKHTLRNSAIHHRSLSAGDREKLFRKCNENVPDFEKYLSRWLMVSEAEHIKRDDVKDFIRWAFFDPRQIQERHQQQEEEIEGAVDL